MYQILSLPAPPPPFLRRQLGCCLDDTDSLDGASTFDLDCPSNQDLRAIVTYFDSLGHPTQDAIQEMGQINTPGSAIIIGLRAIINDYSGQDRGLLMQTYLEQQFNPMLAKP